MDPLNLHPCPPCPTLLCPLGGPILNWLYSVSGVARLQSRQPAAVFYHFRHPTPYAYVGRKMGRVGRVMYQVRGTVRAEGVSVGEMDERVKGVGSEKIGTGKGCRL
jgi:hypothetical protein